MDYLLCVVVGFTAMAFGRPCRGIVERVHAEKEAKKMEGRRGTTNRRRKWPERQLLKMSVNKERKLERPLRRFFS
jgi:hypothetical protein